MGYSWIAILSAAALTAARAGAMPVQNAKSEFAKWAAIKKVYPGDAQPLGSYDSGCLAGATQIEAEGTGFATMRRSRHRDYAHPEMKAYLHALGAKLQEMKMPVLLVGDISPPRGGPTLSGHASHQTGLDADLWLTMAKSRPTKRQRETMNAPSFVSGHKQLRKSWSETQVKLIATAASFDTVDRIFVSPPIKKYFCDRQPDAAWLYKLRPWWGHEEHIHVRLHCPPDSAACVPRPALDTADNGCGTSLTWWFSKEADDKRKEMAADHSPREFPTLPSECGKMVLRESNT